MKQHLLSSLGTIAFLSVLAGTPWQAAQAVPFSPPPGNASPSQATGGASRGTAFVPPRSNSAPQQSTGGASRGTMFAPPRENSAPQQATGGASRGTTFAPPRENAAPQQATGGASRGTTFAPPADNASPQQASGGASRGSIFTPPIDNSAPRNAAGGASRTNLQGDYASGQGLSVALMALTPQSFYGTTLSERPVFMVYVPSSDAREIVFSIKDQDDNMHYQMRLPAPAEAGVVAIQLPADAPALELGKNYHWYTAVLVDGSMSPSTPFVDAWVQRIEASPELAQAMKLERGVRDVEILAKGGVWYDSISALARLRTAQPTSETLADNWGELLNSVGLDDVATAGVSSVN
jgi:Domain of Unknown Function (DUF928)